MKMKKIKVMLCLLVLGVAGSVMALPPEVEFDILKSRMAGELEAGNYYAVLDVLKEMSALDVELPDSMGYFEGQALFETDDYVSAKQKLEAYIVAAGREGQYYSEAINYLAKIGSGGKQGAIDWINSHLKNAEQGYFIEGVNAGNDLYTGLSLTIDAGQMTFIRKVKFSSSKDFISESFRAPLDKLSLCYFHEKGSLALQFQGDVVVKKDLDDGDLTKRDKVYLWPELFGKDKAKMEEAERRFKTIIKFNNKSQG